MSAAVPQPPFRRMECEPGAVPSATAILDRFLHHAETIIVLQWKEVDTADTELARLRENLVKRTAGPIAEGEHLLFPFR